MSDSAVTKAHEGGCLCGRVRYRISARLTNVAHCHCSMCRRASGAPFVTWVVIPADSFEITKGTPAMYPSSEDSERRFCPACGTQLTFWTSRAADGIDVTVGSLDDPEACRANRHVWTSGRLRTLHVDDGLPAFPEGTPKGFDTTRSFDEAD